MVLKNELDKDIRILVSVGVYLYIGDFCFCFECFVNGEKGEVEYMIIGEGYLELMDFWVK